MGIFSPRAGHLAAGVSIFPVGKPILILIFFALLKYHELWYYKFKVLFTCTYYCYIQNLSIFKNVENKFATLPEMQT